MERENTSPHSNGSSSTTTSNGSSSHLIPTPPLTPTNSYPTTFIQADATTFKQVVQMLTGSSSAVAKQPSPSATRGGGGGGIPPIKSTGQKKQTGFKLYERRNSLKNGLMMIDTVVPLGLVSARKQEILSPSILDFPAMVISPATPLNEDTAASKPSTTPAAVEEENAIAEKKFYFYPSPRTAAATGVAAPQLLPLFPVISPRVSGSS